MGRRLAFLIALALFPLPGVAATHLVLEGPSRMSDAALLYGCIAYQGCNDTYFTLGPKNERVHIRSDVDYATVSQFLEHCDLSLVRSRLIFADENGVPRPIALPPVSELASPYQWPELPIGWTPKLFPAVVGKGDLARIEQVYRKYKGVRAPDAVPRMLAEIGLPMRGFTIYFTGAIDSAKAITHADAYKVQFDSEPVDMEYLVAMLHEFTHVQQWEIFDACTKRKPHIAFWSHSKRERAAYLGMFVTRLLPDADEGYAASQLFDEIRKRPND